MTTWRIWLLGVLCAATVATARAEGADDLDRLFVDLAQADTADAAAPIESAIWSAWNHAGDVTSDDMMDRGIYAMEQGLFPLAAEIFTILIANVPELSEAWNKRATVRYLVGDLDGSVSDIGETLKREPRHFGALSGLGLIYMEQGRDRAAVQVFERVLAIHPQMSSARDHVRTLRDKIRGSEI